MSYDVSILRAMLRLARKREAAGVEALVLRAGGEANDARSALRRLEQQGMIERVIERGGGERARLTFVGFAVAYAMRSKTTTRHDGVKSAEKSKLRDRRARVRRRAA